jgi:hypothetical protein
MRLTALNRLLKLETSVVGDGRLIVMKVQDGLPDAINQDAASSLSAAGIARQDNDCVVIIRKLGEGALGEPRVLSVASS